jgi:hypothetical protein
MNTHPRKQQEAPPSGAPRCRLTRVRHVDVDVCGAGLPPAALADASVDSASPAVAKVFIDRAPVGLARASTAASTPAGAPCDQEVIV